MELKTTTIGIQFLEEEEEEGGGGGKGMSDLCILFKRKKVIFGIIISSEISK